MFFFDAQVDDCEAFEIAIVEPASIRSRNLEALLNGKIDVPVGHTLFKRKDHARYCQESLRGVSAPRRAAMSSSRTMLICKSKPFSMTKADRDQETHQSYRRILDAANTTFPEGLSRSHFRGLIAKQAGEVAAARIKTCLPVLTCHCSEVISVRSLGARREPRDSKLPFIHKFVNLLCQRL
jgi:hypothetical protein